MKVAWLGWLTRDWQTYLIVVNAVCAPVLLVFAFFVRESPRWHIQKGQYKAALGVLEVPSLHPLEKNSQIGAGKWLQDVRWWNSRVGKPKEAVPLREVDIRDADPVDPAGPRAQPRASPNFCALFQGREMAIKSATIGVPSPTLPSAWPIEGCCSSRSWRRRSCQGR